MRKTGRSVEKKKRFVIIQEFLANMKPNLYNYM